MTARRRGRPRVDGLAVSPERILSEALVILDADGLDGLTMRALATRVGITPMAIYHHFTDRDGLIKAIAERVYADIEVPETGEPLARAHSLLKGYYSRVALYPALTLAIFARPTIVPDHARRITNALSQLLGGEGPPFRWTHILIDYTHGAALAAASKDGNVGPQRSSGAMLGEFESGLTELLKAFGKSGEA
jgi:AcrR family transcriptional regulator